LTDVWECSIDTVDARWGSSEALSLEYESLSP